MAMKEIHTGSVSLLEVNAKSASAPNHADGQPPIPAPPASGSALADNAKFLARLNVVAAMRRAGLDPDVTMSFMTLYLDEARATLYNKIERGELPKPVKRGYSSFWPLSVVDAYKAGSKGAHHG